MDIENASLELYSKLRMHKEVVGIAVTHANGIHCIVVYLSKISKIITNKIPSIYKGNEVKTELVGNIFLH